LASLGLGGRGSGAGVVGLGLGLEFRRGHDGVSAVLNSSLLYQPHHSQPIPSDAHMHMYRHPNPRIIIDSPIFKKPVSDRRRMADEEKQAKAKLEEAVKRRCVRLVWPVEAGWTCLAGLFGVGRCCALLRAPQPYLLAAD